MMKNKQVAPWRWAGGLAFFMFPVLSVIFAGAASAQHSGHSGGQYLFLRTTSGDMKQLILASLGSPGFRNGEWARITTDGVHHG